MPYPSLFPSWAILSGKHEKMIGLHKNTLNPCGTQKGVIREERNGAILMTRPPPETGNICQEFQRSQLGIALMLPGESGHVAGQVQEQATDVEKPSFCPRTPHLEPHVRETELQWPVLARGPCIILLSILGLPI